MKENTTRVDGPRQAAFGASIDFEALEKGMVGELEAGQLELPFGIPSEVDL